MPASTDRPENPSRQRAKARFLAKIESGELRDIPAKEKQEVTELPRWVKTALILRAIEGMSWNEAAERFGRKGNTLSQYGKSPAAAKWLSTLEEFLEDPVALAKAYIGANALSVSLDRFAFLEAAIAAGDYKEGDKIARDLQDRMGIIAKKAGGEGAISVKINLGGGLTQLEGPVVEAEWETEGDDEDD